MWIGMGLHSFRDVALGCHEHTKVSCARMARAEPWGVTTMNSRKNFKTGQLQRTALALALGLGFSGLAFGQATTGSIFGQVTPGSGESVLVKSTSGITRQVPVDASGRYAVDSLPLGNYTVTLQHAGQAVD